jgi:flagellar hook assembly protein FlgD
LSITDKQTGQKTSLRGLNSLQVTASKDRPSRFVIEAKTEVTRPLAITKLQVAPGGSRSLGGSYAYLLGINQDANVTATIQSQSGNTIGVLAAGRASRSGENRLVWNGRNQNGAAVPAGTYTLEVRVTNDSGDVHLRTLPVTVVR